jgi:hypothetical protein
MFYGVSVLILQALDCRIRADLLAGPAGSARPWPPPSVHRLGPAGIRPLIDLTGGPHCERLMECAWATANVGRLCSPESKIPAQRRWGLRHGAAGGGVSVQQQPCTSPSHLFLVRRGVSESPSLSVFSLRGFVRPPCETPRLRDSETPPRESLPCATLSHPPPASQERV